MGPYGSVGAHIKTGRSPMAQDHFQIPPDPKKGPGMTKNPQKSKNVLKLAKQSKTLDMSRYRAIWAHQKNPGPGPGPSGLARLAVRAGGVVSPANSLDATCAER